MRHRRRGHKLGRTSTHRSSMLRNLASSLILTEREVDDLDPTKPKVKGRVVTTIEKAKAVRPVIERCITIARRSLEHSRKAEEFGTSAARNSDDWKAWRRSDRWHKWCDAMAPALAARRHALQMLGDKKAVSILFRELGPRFEDRSGGYTRILRLAKPRLGDAGTRAIIEFVGNNDRTVQRSQKPSFADEAGGEAAPATASSS